MFAILRACKWQLLTILGTCLFVPVACAVAPSEASIESDYVRTDFTIEDGLPDNTVNVIVQTQNGLLWVGTESGLASFDGRIFTPVRLRIPGAAPPGAVSALVEGADGDLWVGSDAGIVRIPKSDLNDPYLATSTAYRLGKEQSDEVEALFKARDGTIWAGTNHGLYRFDGHRFVSQLASIYVSRIKQALDGTLLVITGSGLLNYDGHAAAYHPGLGARFGVHDDQIFDVFQDAQGTLWYGTNKGTHAIGSHAPADLYPHQQATTAAFRISADSHGVLWISTGVGVYRVVGATLQSPAPGLRARASMPATTAIYGWVQMAADSLICTGVSFACTPRPTVFYRTSRWPYSAQRTAGSGSGRIAAWPPSTETISDVQRKGWPGEFVRLGSGGRS